MQVNFLSAFYLTNLFLLRYNVGRKPEAAAEIETPSSSSAQPRRPELLRIVNVSSDSYCQGRLNLDDLMMTSSTAPAPTSRGIYETYADSKLALMLFTMELNFRHSANGITCLAAHPGEYI